MTDDMERRITDFLATPEMKAVEENQLDEMVHEAFAGMAACMNNAGSEDQSQILRESGFEPNALDDPDKAIHSIFSTRASEVNNSGLTGQIRILFQADMDENAILEALEINLPDPGMP